MIPNPYLLVMTGKQLILEEQIQCHGLKDGGHSTAEYHDPVCICYKQHIQRWVVQHLPGSVPARARHQPDGRGRHTGHSEHRGPCWTTPCNTTTRQNSTGNGLRNSQIRLLQYEGILCTNTAHMHYSIETISVLTLVSSNVSKAPQKQRRTPVKLT